MTIEQVVIWIGVVGFFAILMAGVPKGRKNYVKSTQFNGYPKYTKINRYN